MQGIGPRLGRERPPIGLARRVPWTAATLLTLAFARLAAGAPSAEALKPGDAVQVNFGDKWSPGTVVAVKSPNLVTVEFEIAGRMMRRPFARNDVRLAFEADALAKARVWSDSSGNFRIRAVLLAVDNDTVTLRKPDMTEVKVPIDRLSETDQEFLKRLGKESAAKPPPPPAVEQFGTAAATESGVASRAALTPDPIPGYLKMKQGGMGFPVQDFFDHVGAVLPIGGKDGWLLAAAESGHHGAPLPTRLLWVALDRQKIEGRQLLPPGEVVLDYHVPSRRLLTHAMVKTADAAQATAVLTLWEVVPTDAQVKAIVRWHGQTDRPAGHEPWARVVDRDTVVHRCTKQDLVGWDVTKKQLKYYTTQESFFAPQPTLSGGRKQVFLPEDKEVRILDAVTGRAISSLPAEDGASAVAVSEDGRFAAVLGRTALTVWDLTDAAAPPQRYQAEALGAPFEATLYWVGPERVMVESVRGLVLFSLPHKLPLWTYQFDRNTAKRTAGRRMWEILDEHLVYTASASAGLQRVLAVGAVRLPGPKVDEAAASLDPESLLIIKPGTAVRLDVKAGTDTPRVQAALEQKIKANEWTLGPNASAVITAEMTRGKTQQVTYRLWGPGRPPRHETVTVTPYVSNIRIEVSGKVAWQSATSSGAPGSITLREGQSVQGEVDRWQRPNVEFFEKLNIPPRISDPAKRTGLGATDVTTRGLIAR